MRRNPHIVLAAVLLSTVALPITLTGASVALADIGRDLDAGLTSLQWVVTGYNATFASFMLAFGSLADVVGRRRVYGLGLGLFTLTGLVSTVATDILVLDVVRVLAGIGAAAAAATGSALLAATFEGPARTRAFGLFGTTLGAGLAFGPSIAGVLVDAFGWRSVFLVPALVTSVVLAILPLLPESRGATGRRVDVPGTISFTLLLLLLIAAVVEGPRQGWASPPILGAFAVSAILLIVFVVVERRQESPMFDFDLLRNRPFVAFTAAAATIVSVVVPLLVYLPSYLTEVLGMSSGRAGTVLIMLTAPTLLLPMLGSLLARRVSGAALAITSVVLVGLGAGWLTVIDPQISVPALAGPLLTLGLGMGLSLGLVDGVALGSIDTRQAGAAAGMLNTARLTLETVVIAVFGAVLASSTGGRLAEPGYTEGLHHMLWGLVGLSAGTVGLAAVLLRRRAAATAPLESTGTA